MSKPSRRPRAGSSAGRQTSTSASTRGGTTEPTRPLGSTPVTRAGRRERPRYSSTQRSFFERYRTPIFVLAGGAAVILVVGFLFFGATAKGYSCGQIWQPSPTASPEPGSTGMQGYVQRDMGNSHVVNQPQRYALCPPASGPHFQAPLGPITPRVYGPDDSVEPMNWVHNLEHGGLVVLYKCQGDACDDTGQDRLRQFFNTFPNSPICNTAPGLDGPVIARFEDMASPYAALLWGRVLPLQTFDQAQILEFFRTTGDRTGIERRCDPNASPSPSPGASPSPSGSPSASPSGSPSVSPSPVASPSPSASPS